ncbi:hypothetical protein EDB19DRAFT_1395025 [Suillus lakei]|nr:hypothetical protein EDB19DRAFT_1395025 [Suillus lakei]
MHICINSGAEQFLTSGCPCLELLFWCCNVHVTLFLILTRSLPSPPGQHSSVEATLASYVDLCQFNSDESRRDICVPTHRTHAKSASVSEARRGRPLNLLFVGSRTSEISMLREPSLSTRISLMNQQLHIFLSGRLEGPHPDINYCRRLHPYCLIGEAHYDLNQGQLNPIFTGRETH